MWFLSVSSALVDAYVYSSASCSRCDPLRKPHVGFQGQCGQKSRDRHCLELLRTGTIKQLLLL
jgi:hypothetical protein